MRKRARVALPTAAVNVVLTHSGFEWFLVAVGFVGRQCGLWVEVDPERAPLQGAVVEHCDRFVGASRAVKFNKRDPTP